MEDEDSRPGRDYPGHFDDPSATSFLPPVTQAQALVDTNDDVDEAEKNVLSYLEIANLQDINLKYPFLRLALEDWQRKEAYLSIRVSRNQGRIDELTNHIYHIFGWFVVFQGLVLIAVSQLTQTAKSELPLCGKVWSPIVISVLGALAAIVGILKKFRSLQSLELTVHSERQARTEVAHRVLRLRRDGPRKFKFNLHAGESWRSNKAKSIWKNFYLVALSIVTFTCVCILSYFVILCDTGVIQKWD